MPVRIKDGIIPYTGGQGIEITNNHVINVLLREMNNLIQVNGDRELYVDLQLPDGIEPTDDFPVGVTTGKILQEDGWTQSGIILNWKTTSGDYVRLIYANDGKLYYDPGTGTWRLLECDCNTKTFFIQNENDLTTMTQAIQYHNSGKDAILRLRDDNPTPLRSELPGTFLFISERFEESPEYPGGYWCYEFAEPITRYGTRRVVELHENNNGQVFEIKMHNESTSYFYSIPVVGADITALWKDLYANRYYERKINAPEYFRRADSSGSWEHWFISGMADDGGYPTFSGTITAERDGKIMTIAYSGTFTPEESVSCDSIEIKSRCNGWHFEHTRGTWSGSTLVATDITDGTPALGTIVRFRGNLPSGGSLASYLSNVSFDSGTTLTPMIYPDSDLGYLSTWGDFQNSTGLAFTGVVTDAGLVLIEKCLWVGAE